MLGKLKGKERQKCYLNLTRTNKTGVAYKMSETEFKYHSLKLVKYRKRHDSHTHSSSEISC